MRVARCALLALLASASVGVCVSGASGSRVRGLAPVRREQQQNCTTYARQDNCVGNPPLRQDALPACGSFAGPLPANTSAFAIIGDFGLDGQCMSQVAALTLKLQQQFGQLEFVMTLGDNAYWTGACESLQTGVGKYYSSFLPGGVAPACNDPQLVSQHRAMLHLTEKKRFEAHQADVAARQAETADMADAPAPVSPEQRERSLQALLAHANKTAALKDAPIRFYPSLGNHDWTTYGSDPSTLPYFQFFPYLRNLEPAELAAGQFFHVSTPVDNVDLFSLNSNLGNPASSDADRALFDKMVSWLEGAVKNSKALFKIVHFHHPPFTTAQHDPLSPWMDLDYEAWGVSLVLAGHEHVYERMLVSRDGGHTTMPYVVNGLGGHPWTYTVDNCPIYPGSLLRYNKFHGMQLAIRSYDAQAGKDKIDVCFYSLEDGGTLIDQFPVLAGGNNQTAADSDL